MEVKVIGNILVENYKGNLIINKPKIATIIERNSSEQDEQIKEEIQKDPIIKETQNRFRIENNRIYILIKI